VGLLTDVASRPVNSRLMELARSERHLQSGLEKLRVALDAEAVELPVGVTELPPDVVREVPIDHRRQAPHLPAGEVPGIEVDVREMQDGLPRPRPSLEHGAVR